MLILGCHGSNTKMAINCMTAHTVMPATGSHVKLPKTMFWMLEVSETMSMAAYRCPVSCRCLCNLCIRQIASSALLPSLPPLHVVSAIFIFFPSGFNCLCESGLQHFHHLVQGVTEPVQLQVMKAIGIKCAV